MCGGDHSCPNSRETECNITAEVVWEYSYAGYLLWNLERSGPLIGRLRHFVMLSTDES